MEGSSRHSQKRHRAEDEIRCGELLDLDVLDCPVCFEPLTIPIFQCDDGHIVCSFCFAKVSSKCPGPGCDLPIGKKRCFPVEKVLQSVLVPCRYAEFGCTNNFSYGNVSSHEKECNFSLCSCPNLGCNYTGSYNTIYSHFIRSHVDNHDYLSYIWENNSAKVLIDMNDKILVLWEDNEGLLFVVQCFTDRHGVYVTVRLIAPPSRDLRMFSYRLSCSVDGHVFTHESPKVKRLLEVSSQSPDESFMFGPNSLLRGEMLEIDLCIKKLNQD